MIYYMARHKKQSSRFGSPNLRFLRRKIQGASVDRWKLGIQPNSQELRHMQRVARIRKIERLKRKYTNVWERTKLLENPAHLPMVRLNNHDGGKQLATVWYTSYDRRR